MSHFPGRREGLNCFPLFLFSVYFFVDIWVVASFQAAFFRETPQLARSERPALIE
jgi:hypothetical protein